MPQPRMSAAPEAPEAPAAMPLVALILSGLGLCLLPLLPVGLVLAIISLARSSDPAYAARKSLAIVALALPLALVPIVGALAAIAIPNFVRYQARAKQAECKTQLKAALVAEKAYHAEFDAYSSHPAELGFTSVEPRRYLYRFAGHGPLASGAAGADDVGLAPSGSLGPSSEELDAALGPALTQTLGVHGECPACDVTIACAGNVDQDSAIDVWSISTADRLDSSGAAIPAGTPYHHVDDLTAEARESPAPAPSADAPPRGGDELEAVDDREASSEHRWVTYSGDGKGVLRQRPLGQRCALECQRSDGAPGWETVRACLPIKSARRFVAPDCERFVALIAAPVRGKSWDTTEVMHVYERDHLAYSVMGAAVLPEKRMATSPTWLKGCFGAPGAEPRYSDDGLSVEYVMIDGTPGHVSLVAAANDEAPAPPPKRRPTKKRARPE